MIEETMMKFMDKWTKKILADLPVAPIVKSCKLVDYSRGVLVSIEFTGEDSPKAPALSFRSRRLAKVFVKKITGCSFYPSGIKTKEKENNRGLLNCMITFECSPYIEEVSQ